MPRWPSRLGRQTHREITKSVLWSPEKSGGHGFGSRPGHIFSLFISIPGLVTEPWKKFHYQKGNEGWELCGNRMVENPYSKSISCILKREVDS